MGKNKRVEHFNIAMMAVFASIAISLLAFIGADNSGKVTGFAVSDSIASNTQVQQPELLQFKSIGSLSDLSSGAYYVDEKGVVYWMDDSSMPPVGQVAYLRESQKNRQIYVDNDGNVGYLIR